MPTRTKYSLVYSRRWDRNAQIVEVLPTRGVTCYKIHLGNSSYDYVSGRDLREHQFGAVGGGQRRKPSEFGQVREGVGV